MPFGERAHTSQRMCKYFSMPFVRLHMWICEYECGRVGWRCVSTMEIAYHKHAELIWCINNSEIRQLIVLHITSKKEMKERNETVEKDRKVFVHFGWSSQIHSGVSLDTNSTYYRTLIYYFVCATRFFFLLFVASSLCLGHLDKFVISICCFILFEWFRWRFRKLARQNKQLKSHESKA